jgi:hypothetical protein
MSPVTSNAGMSEIFRSPYLNRPKLLHFRFRVVAVLRFSSIHSKSGQ